jgi:hypothetical protein
VEKLPLGKLVTLLRFDQRVSLQTDLQKIIPARNRLAHFFLDNTIGERTDSTWLMERVNEMKGIENFVRKVRCDVLDELNKLRRMAGTLERADTRSGTQRNPLET